jgi:hypothetical protein
MRAELTAYIDETGHPSHKEGVLGFAGFIAANEDWSTFQQEWRAVCPGKFFPFHMRQFVKKARSASERRDVLAALMGCIARNKLVPHATVVPLDKYHSLSAPDRKTIGNLYYVGLAQLMNQIGSAVLAAIDTNDVIPIMPRVSVVFAKGEYSGRAVESWWDSKASGMGSPLAAPLSGMLIEKISVSTPSETIPLQAADVWAWELGHYHRVIRPKDKALTQVFDGITQLPNVKGVAERSYVVMDNDLLLLSDDVTLI